MMTYKKVREFVKQKYNYYAADCHIAHVKELNGLNKVVRAVEQFRVKPCPDTIRPMIEDAFRTNGDL